MKYDFRKRSDDAKYFCEGESLTKQEFRSQVNINNILKKYAKNGVDPFCITQDAKYGDFTDVPSYQDALDLVISAGEHFAQLDAATRRRFDNDPGKLLDFLSNRDNYEEAVSLGLIEKKPVVTPPEGEPKA